MIRTEAGTPEGERLVEIARSLSVLSFEFENIPVEAARAMQAAV